MLNIRIWDLPTRLFHWLLAACVIALIITGQMGGGAMPKLPEAPPPGLLGGGGKPGLPGLPGLGGGKLPGLGGGRQTVEAAQDGGYVEDERHAAAAEGRLHEFVRHAHHAFRRIERGDHQLHVEHARGWKEREACA